MGNRILLSVLGFSFNQDKTGAYGLVLAEQNGPRRLMVIVGTPEAQSIAFSLQSSKPPRPLTHDIFTELIIQYGIDLIDVFIYKYEKGVFFSQMTFKQENNTVVIESRTSDAVGIALRNTSPIYTTEAIMQELGVVIDESSSSSDTFWDQDNMPDSPDYSMTNEMELNNLLQLAIENEDYELASVLRDELKKRKE